MSQEIKLKVPLIRQEPHSVECGLATLEMIYSYNGMPKGMDTLRKELPTVEVGTYGPQLGLNLIKHGFNVEIITHNPRLVEREDSKLNQAQLLSKFKSQSKHLTEESDKLAMGYFIKFMQKGGIVTIKIPNIQIIKDYLQKGQPLIANLTNALLYNKNTVASKNKPISSTFHFVIVTGLGNGFVYINDPYWGEEGGEKAYPEEEFLYAVYSCALGDLDNADFMVAYKP